MGDESRRTTLQRPLVAVSRDGTLGLCVSLTRLEAAAPGFGVARAEPGTRFGALAADGLWIQRLDGAEAAPPPRLLLSYERLLAAAQETRRRAAAPAPAPGIEPGSGSGRAKHRGVGNSPLPMISASSCHHALDHALVLDGGRGSAFQYLVTSCDDGAPAGHVLMGLGGGAGVVKGHWGSRCLF